MVWVAISAVFATVATCGEDKGELVGGAGGLVVEGPVEISPGTKICLFNDPSGVTIAMPEQRAKEPPRIGSLSGPS